jgi:hypothetical protein
MKAAERAGIPKQGFWQLHCAIGYCKMLQDKFNFPLRMIISILLKRPLLKTQKIADSDGLAAFLNCRIPYWSAQHSIKKDVDFIIERASSFDSQNEEKKPLILTKTETKLFL